MYSTNESYIMAILKQYGLEQYYDPEEGFAVFLDDEVNIVALFPKIQKFLVNNEDWVFGHDLWGTDYGYWYLEPRGE